MDSKPMRNMLGIHTNKFINQTPFYFYTSKYGKKYSKNIKRQCKSIKKT